MKKVKFCVLMALVAMFMFVGCNNNNDVEEIEYSPETEKIVIDEYITFLGTKGYDVDTLSEGIYYVEIEQGEGDFVQSNDTLEITYIGYLTNGQIFDDSERHDGKTNFKDGRYYYVHKVDGMIPGWEKSIELMNAGSKMLLILSSSNAYGPYGNGPIPPYRPIVFDIELHSINDQDVYQ